MILPFGSRNFVEAGRKPIVAVVIGCGLTLYLAYHLTRFQLSAVWPPAPQGDA